MPETPGSATLVFLFGPAASGKLTTARSVASRTGYPVFHNHLTVDLLTTVFPFGSEPFVRLREQLWLSVIADAIRTGRSLIFTFAPERTVRAGFADRVRERVEAAGGRICFVELLVGEVEQERRITAVERSEFHKLSDLETLRAVRQRADVVEQPPADLVVDTDVSSAEESAAAVVGHFHLLPEVPVRRYLAPDG